MADRGFRIEDLLLKCGASLVVPPFTRQWNTRKGKNKRLNVGDSENEVDCQAAYPCGTSSTGLPTGYQVSDRNKTKIWAHQYVDFQDILFNSTSDPTYTMSIHDAGNAPTLQFAPQKKRSLNQARMVHRLG